MVNPIDCILSNPIILLCMTKYDIDVDKKLEWHQRQILMAEFCASLTEETVAEDFL